MHINTNNTIVSHSEERDHRACHRCRCRPSGPTIGPGSLNMVATGCPKGVKFNLELYPNSIDLQCPPLLPGFPKLSLLSWRSLSWSSKRPTKRRGRPSSQEWPATPSPGMQMPRPTRRFVDPAILSIDTRSDGGLLGCQGVVLQQR